MNLTELRTQIEILAWGPRGNPTLQAATAHPSPVYVVDQAFTDLGARVSELDTQEVEILRNCCRIIREAQLMGKAGEAAAIEAMLPPMPEPELPVMDPPNNPLTQD